METWAIASELIPCDHPAWHILGPHPKHYDLRKTRLGLRKCFEKACRKQFTVKVGTVFESAHILFNKVLQAI